MRGRVGRLQTPQGSDGRSRGPPALGWRRRHCGQRRTGQELARIGVKRLGLHVAVVHHERDAVRCDIVSPIGIGVPHDEHLRAEPLGQRRHLTLISHGLRGGGLARLDRVEVCAVVDLEADLDESLLDLGLKNAAGLYLVVRRAILGRLFITIMFLPFVVNESFHTHLVFFLETHYRLLLCT